MGTTIDSTAADTAPRLAALQAEQDRLGAQRMVAARDKQQIEREIALARERREHLYSPAAFERRTLALARVTATIENICTALAVLEPQVTALDAVLHGAARERERERLAPVTAALEAETTALAQDDTVCEAALTAALQALQGRRDRLRRIATMRGELGGGGPLHDEAFWTAIRSPRLYTRLEEMADVLGHKRK